MKPLAISVCSIPLLAKQARQNNSAASDFKVCVTTRELFIEAQNFVCRISGENGRMDHILQPRFLSGKTDAKS